MDFSSLAVQVMTGLARAGLAAFGGYLMKKGIDDGGLVQTVTGSLPVIVAGGWSWFNKVVMHKALVEAKK